MSERSDIATATNGPRVGVLIARHDVAPSEKRSEEARTGTSPITFAWPLAIAGAALLGVSGRAHASSATEWIQGVFALAKDCPTHDGMYVEWRATSVHVPEQSELDNLRREVPDHPEHPDAGQLRRYEAIIAGHPPTLLARVWVFAGQWRLCWDFEDQINDQGLPKFMDRAVYGDEVWTLGADSTSRGTRSHPHLAVASVVSERGMVAQDIWLFATGGLSDVPVTKFTAPTLDDKDGPWRFSLRNQEKGLLLVVEGTFDVQTGAGTVTRIAYTSPTAKFGGHQYLSEAWASTPIGIMMAGRVEERTLQGRPIDRRELLQARPVASAEFTEIARTPSPDQSDAVRGALNLSRIRDYRSAEPVQSVKAVGPDGPEPKWYSAPIASAVHARNLTHLGWWLGSSVLSLLVAIRVLKRS